MTEPRCTLRPGYLGLVRGRLWVLDRLQPTAVVLDPDTGAVLARPSWPQVPPSPTLGTGDPDGAWRVHADDAGVWVQQPNGPVAVVSEHGMTGASHTAGRTLATRSAHGVWCAPGRPGPELAGRPDGPPPLRAPRAGLTLLPTGGGPSRDVWVDTPGVHRVQAVDGDLYLLVEEGTGVRVPLYPGGAHRWAPDLRWTRLPAGRPVPDDLVRADLVPAAEPAQAPSRRNAARLWSSHPDHLGARGEPAGDRVWRVAADPGQPPHARAWTEPTGGLQVDLGPGTPVAALGTGDHLWVAVAEPRVRDVHPRPAPTALVRIDARTGATWTVLAAGSVDVTDRCWPLGPAPIDAEDYAHCWHARLARDLSADCRPPWTGGRAHLVGTWPDTAVHLTVDLDEHPGTPFERVVPLFDELGRPTPPEDAVMSVWADLATGRHRPPGDPAAAQKRAR